MQHEPAYCIFTAFLQDFQKGLSIVRGLNLTNDAAERGVDSIQSFNRSITTMTKNKSSFHFKSSRNIDEAYQIRTNQN